MDKYDRLAAAAQVARDANNILKDQMTAAREEYAEKKTPLLPTRQMPGWAAVQEAGAKVFELLLAEFRGEISDTEKAQAKAFFENTEPGNLRSTYDITDAASIRELGLSDTQVAVMAAHWLLTRELLPLNLHEIDAFAEFADYFKDVILN